MPGKYAMSLSQSSRGLTQNVSKGASNHRSSQVQWVDSLLHSLHYSKHSVSAVVIPGLGWYVGPFSLKILAERSDLCLGFFLASCGFCPSHGALGELMGARTYILGGDQPGTPCFSLSALGWAPQLST